MVHAHTDEEVRRHIPVTFEHVQSEVLHAFLLHDSIDLLEQITKIEWIKFGEFEDSLMRNDDEIRAAVPVEINVAKSPLHVEMG